MTIKNVNLSDMIDAAAKAAASVETASASLLDRAADLFDNGVTPAQVSRDGDLLSQFQTACANAILTKAQLVTWADTSLAAKISAKGPDGKRKQTNTARGLLVDRVNSVVRRIRDALKEIENNPKARGTKEKTTPTQAFFKVIDGYVERFGKDDASDKFEFDPIMARAALVKMLDSLR